MPETANHFSNSVQRNATLYKQITFKAGGEYSHFRIGPREAGLSRPHFYKLFRIQTGVTPNLYLNTLLMEKALDCVVTSESPMADIASELGFSCQSVFTRFFAGNVGMAPTEYRRAAKVLRA